MFEKRRIEDNKAFKQYAIDDLNKLIEEANQKGQFDLTERLHAIKNRIQSSAVTDAKELPLFFVAIRRYCLDIQEDLNANNYKTAQTRLKDFEATVKDLVDLADRNKISLSKKEAAASSRIESRLEKAAKKAKIKIDKRFSIKEINASTLYQDETIAELRLAGLQDQLDRAQAELEELRNSKDYGSQLTKAKINKKKQDIAMIKQLVQIANNAMFSEYETELMREATEQVKNDYAYQTKKWDKAQEEIRAEWEAVKAKHGLTGVDDNAILNDAGEVDAEEKFFELMNDFKRIKNEIKENNKEINRVLRKAKDLAEDKKSATGTELEQIEDEIRDLKAEYQGLAQKKQLLQQRKADAQTAYQVIARNRNFDEIREKYAGVDKDTVNLVKEIAGQYTEKVEEANELHEELTGIGAVAMGTEIATDNYADVDLTKAGAQDSSDLDDFIALAEQQAD